MTGKWRLTCQITFPIGPTRLGVEPVVAWPRQRFVYQSNCHVWPTSAMATGVASGWGDGSSETWNQHQALHSCSNENPEAPGARRSLGYLQPRMGVSVGHPLFFNLIILSCPLLLYHSEFWFAMCCLLLKIIWRQTALFSSTFICKPGFVEHLFLARLLLCSISEPWVHYLPSSNTSSTHDFPSQRWFAHGDFAIFCHDSQFWFPCIPGFPAFSHYFSAFCP